MTTLYNCKHDGDQFRITKFDSDFNVEASYLLDASNCECPAGHRPSCRHRSMLPKFIARNAIGTQWFFDHDRGGWVQGWKEEPVAHPLSVQLKQPLPPVSFVPIEDRAGLVYNEIIAEMLAPEGLGQTSDPEPSPYPCTEENCFGHVASKNDPKVCGLCGTHIDSLRPDEEPSPSSPHSPTATTTGFDSVDSGSIPLVAAKGTIRRRV